MYSFFPAPTVISSVQPGALFVGIIIMLIASIVVAAVDERNEWPVGIAAILICASLVFVSHNDAIATPTVYQPVNERVIGEFISFQAGAQPHKTGHNYVIYRTPDGDLIFPAAAGVPYPKFAILYKN